MTFNDLRALVRTEEGPLAVPALLAALSGAACCVRGLWAARSADLYTRALPVPARLLCAARDHVVCTTYYFKNITETHFCHSCGKYIFMDGENSN